MAPISTFTNRLLITAAAAAASALFAQPAREPASTDPEARLLEQIAELQTKGGPTPVGLIDLLRALAVLHQENGDHTLAIAALEEARYVTRVHQGLSSADEALLLRQQIRSEKALGLHQRVWDLEQDMVTIARQNHDDIRMATIFRDLAEDRSDVIEKVGAGERPPIVFIGCYYGAARPRYDDPRGERRAAERTSDVGPDPSCSGGTQEGILDRLELEVLTYYADAIETILKSGDYASQELRQLERAALRVRGVRSDGTLPALGGASGASFAPCSGGTLDDYLALDILSSCLAPVGRGDGWVVPNVGTRVGLIRLVSYEVRSGASAAARANAVAELADWYLVRAHNDYRSVSAFDETALTLYERAYAEIRRGDQAQLSTAQIFAPELPVTLPNFEPNPFATAAARESPRYIDVAFAVTKNGRAEEIEILDTSRGATRADERKLKRLIGGTTFRPRVVDGDIAAAAPVVVRYALDR